MRTTLKQQYTTSPLIITSTSIGHHMHQISGKWAPVICLTNEHLKSELSRIKQFFHEQNCTHFVQLLKFLAK